MLSLLRPIQDIKNKQLRLGSFSSPDATPGALYSASMSQLKALMVAYCADLTPRGGNAWFNCAFLEVFADLIKNPVKDAHWHFYLQICFEFWKKTYVRYRTFNAVTRAMLLSAVNAGVVEYDFAAKMKKELRSAAPYHDALNDTVSSSGRLSFELALAGTEETSVDYLAMQLDELFLVHELTNWEEAGGDDSNESVG